MESLELKTPDNTDRISIADDDEILFWAEKFGVSPDHLKRAIVEVGTSKELLQRHIKGTLTDLLRA